MSSTVFKPMFLHGVLVAIGLIAGTYSNHLSNSGGSTGVDQGVAENEVDSTESVLQAHTSGSVRDIEAIRIGSDDLGSDGVSSEIVAAIAGHAS